MDKIRQLFVVILAIILAIVLLYVFLFWDAACQLEKQAYKLAEIRRSR